MKKILSMALVLTLVICLAGCNSVRDVSDSNKASEFICIEKTDNWIIVYHEETKVMYAVSGGGRNAGTFTLLVNADGSPMLYESED